MESKKTAADFGATPEDFERWRSPREGTENPTRFDNPVWQWLIETRLGAYQAVTEMGAEYGQSVTWCFDRYGQSSTNLPDGSVVFIGGEHEDYYDPDFFIYNDVVVRSPDGQLRIFGYPKTDFPPTDFHSATLVGNNIYVIGCLGYSECGAERLENIYLLDTNTFKFITCKTSGDCPQWIHEHNAILIGDSIRISGGKVDLKEKRMIVENLSTWDLNLSNLVWTLVEKKNWRRWEFRRVDGKGNSLWRMRSAVFNKRHKWQKDLDEDFAYFTQALGRVPDIDLVEDLYRSRLPSNYVGETGEEYGTYRAEIDNVTIRYVETSVNIQMIIEGTLPDDVCSELVAELKRKLVALESHDYAAQEIP